MLSALFVSTQRFVALSNPRRNACLTLSNLFCRHPWPLAQPRATNLGLFAARPSMRRVCARSIGQRGRQRLTAAAIQQPPHATDHRLRPAPPAAGTRQRPPEAAPGSRQPLLQPEPLAPPVSAYGLLTAHPTPHATTDAFAPEDRSASGRHHPSRYNCTCKHPPEARRAPCPCPPP